MKTDDLKRFTKPVLTWLCDKKSTRIVSIEESTPYFSETIYLDPGSHYAYAIIQHQLASAFFKAEALFMKGYSSPFAISILVPLSAIWPYKEGDRETTIYRIMHWIKNMRPGSGSLLIRIYTYHSFNDHVDEIRYPYSDNFNAIWPFKHRQYTQKNHIALQLPEDFVHNENSTYTRNVKGYSLFDKVKAIATKYDIETIEVDYTTPIEEAQNIIGSSKLFFTYAGACYYLACVIGKKSTVLGYGTKPRYLTDSNGKKFVRSTWAGTLTKQYIDGEIQQVAFTNHNFAYTEKDIIKRFLEAGYNVTN